MCVDQLRPRGYGAAAADRPSASMACTRSPPLFVGTSGDTVERCPRRCSTSPGTVNSQFHVQLDIDESPDTPGRFTTPWVSVWDVSNVVCFKTASPRHTDIGRKAHFARPNPTPCRRRPPKSCCSNCDTASSPPCTDAATPGTTKMAALTRTVTGPLTGSSPWYQPIVFECPLASTRANGSGRH
jgi:hypothetical protein